MFFEHRGLLEGRDARRVHDAGASSFLYPFLDEREDDLEPVVEDVRRSVLMKADEIGALRAQTLTENREVLIAAATALRASFDRGGKLLAFGNGGSATDAMDVVADFRSPGGPRARWPAIDLTEDAAILTAIANDIGTEAIFSRQVIAHGLHGDVLLALSTSGNSANVIAGAGRGPPPRAGHDRAGGLRRRPGRRRRAGRPRGGHRAPSTFPGSRRPRPAPTTCCGSWWSWCAEPAGERGHAAAGAGARGGHRAGRGLPALRVPAGGRAGAGRIRAERRPRGAARGGGRRRRRSSASSPGWGPTPRRWRWSSGSPSRPAIRSAHSGFQIVESPREGAADAAGLPRQRDLRRLPGELFDPADRRYRYPFINCTNCGPRFTIVRGIPYDRPFTTMAGFAMCAALPRASTTIPPTAASTPSPTPVRSAGRRVRCSRRTATGAPDRRRDPVEAAAAALRDGRIVAIKGIGGFHLACRADDERAVAALRARKHREDKPFALMAASAEAAARWCSWRAERARCCWRARPPDRAGPPPRGRRGGGGGRAGRARAGRDAALLAAAPPAARGLRRSGAGDDQRQRLRRADRLPRRRGRRPGWPASPTCCWCTTARSRRAPTIR